MSIQYSSKQNTRENRQPNILESKSTFQAETNRKFINGNSKLDPNEEAISLSYKLVNMPGHINHDLSDSNSFDSCGPADNSGNSELLSNESSISDASHSRLRESRLPPLIKSGKPLITLEYSLSESNDAPSRLEKNEKLPELNQKSKQNPIKQPPPRDTKSKRRNRRDKNDDELERQGLLSHPESIIQYDEEASSSAVELEIQIPKSRAPRRKPTVPRQETDDKNAAIEPETVIPELMSKLIERNKTNINEEDINHDNQEEEQKENVGEEEEEEEHEDNDIPSRISAASRASQIGVLVLKKEEAYSLGRMTLNPPQNTQRSKPFFNNVTEINPLKDSKADEQLNEKEQSENEKETETNNQAVTAVTEKDSFATSPGDKSESIHFSKSDGESNSKRGDLDKLLQYFPFQKPKKRSPSSSSFSLNVESQENSQKTISAKNVSNNEPAAGKNHDEEEEDHYSSDDEMPALSSSVEGPFDYLDEKPDEIMDTTVTKDELLMPNRIDSLPKYHYDPDFDDTLLEPTMKRPKEDREELYAEIEGLGTEDKSSACLLL